MIEPLNHLIAALREELQNYGELLALLDRQQELVMARAAEEIFLSIGAVQTQATLLQQARSHRDHCRRTVAEQLCQPADAAFGTLIPLLPADYRPLVQALVQENNELLVRVQQRARQNHLLLSRSLELMQRFLNLLIPGREVPVYTGVGVSRPQSLPTSAIYEAIG